MMKKMKKMQKMQKKLLCGLEVAVNEGKLIGKIIRFSCICADKVYVNCIECYLTSEKIMDYFRIGILTGAEKQSTKEEEQGFE